MRQQLLPASKMLAVLTVVLGLGYPLAVTGLAQLLFPVRADGSLIVRQGLAVGSQLQAQPFADDRYFEPRPSASDYDATSTGGSDLGPTNPRLLDAVEERLADYRERNHLDASIRVPVDAVTASGSGLDPHISIANARLQASRVARARGLPLDAVLDVVTRHTEHRTLGFLGEPRVNVLLVNLALDAITEH